jgi:HAD superfamily hydrolase (TIGR01484 family)
MNFFEWEGSVEANWMEIEALAMDIDGTLSTAGRFSAEVVATLHALKSAGLKLILVTGRPSGWVQGLASYLPVDAAIAENGGVVFRGSESAPLLRDAKSGHYLVSSAENSTRDQLAKVFDQLASRHRDLRLTEDNVYRLSDYTFHVAGMTPSQLLDIRTEVEDMGFAFTWSTIHAHIMPRGQEKGSALCWLLRQMEIPVFPAHTTLTVGDSPNDATLFDESRFPCTAGVANIEKYRNVMDSFPRFISRYAEGDGFVDIAQRLLRLKGLMP